MVAEFLQFLFSGITVGSTYALAALGFTLIYNSSHVINFAQGEFIMLGGMLAVYFTHAGLPLPLCLLLAIALPAIASALLFNVGASSGGTDIIALIVEKYTHIHSIAVALFITDLFMVIAACFVFDLYTALYSFVGLTVKSLVIDAVLEKIKMCKAILIVCDEKKPICDFVMRKLMRGATYTPCFGAYTDKPHYIIYTTLTRHEADQLQEFIHKEHLNAFMSMLSTTEVFGKGFNHA